MEYYHVYPKLLALVVSAFPQLFGVVQLLHETETKFATTKTFSTLPINFSDASLVPLFSSPDNIRQVLLHSNVDSLQASLILEKLCTLSVEELWSLRQILLDALLPQILQFQ